MRAKVDPSGAVALVTGAGSGIGRAVSLALARAGSTVLAVDLDEQSAARVAAECNEIGPGGEAHACDVRDAEAVRRLAARVHSAHGAVSILVNNAGVGMSGPFLSMSSDDWEWIRSVNLDGVVSCCREFGKAMVERGAGQVVNLSSGLGYTPRATEPAYVTTKAAVLNFSLSLRADWASHGVGVSAICPGVINTHIIQATRFLGDRAAAATVDRTAKLFRRGHDPEKVAGAILDAIRRDRAMVPVGWESWIGWALHRYAPVGIQQLIDRKSPI